MRALISTLVATAVALHSVLGCCRHHAHEADGCGPTGVVVAAHEEHEHLDATEEIEHRCGPTHPHAADLVLEPAANSAHDDFDHGDRNNGGRNRGGPCPRRCPGSCADKGALVASPRVQLEHDLSSVLPSAVLSAWQPALEPDPSPAEFAARDAATYPPPERLHLLHQLLLI